MDNTICYANTDLNLTSPGDLTNLAIALESRGLCSLHVTRQEDGLWYASFETNTWYAEPQTNIVAMIEAVDSLEEPHRSAWFGCTVREFNIGYQCGAEPFPFYQGLSAELLGCLAAAGASLGFTLYPDRERKAANTRPTEPECDAS